MHWIAPQVEVLKHADSVVMDTTVLPKATFSPAPKTIKHDLLEQRLKCRARLIKTDCLEHFGLKS